MPRKTFGHYISDPSWLGPVQDRVLIPLLQRKLDQFGLYHRDSDYARERGRAMQDRLSRGERVYLLGCAPAFHNTGVALVEVSQADGVRLLANNEEERFRGDKHCKQHPELALAELGAQLRDRGLTGADIHACLGTYDYALRAAIEVVSMVRFRLGLMFSPRHRGRGRGLGSSLWTASRQLGEALGLPGPLPIIGMPHHENHAYQSYAWSPFAAEGEPTLVAVIDSLGDRGSLSVYLGQGAELRRVYGNAGIADSIGQLYSLLSSTQGGWTILSSEGRYMGAAAWGDNDRLTNPYYKQLRQILYFGPGGEIRINQALANWLRDPTEPYTPALTAILGEPIPHDRMWNPDAVLSVDDVQHSEITRDRVDKAAATQLVFEDALFHVIEHWVRSTGASRLVLAGGCALNCLANMRLLQRLDEAYYARYLGRPDTRLRLWVSPTPGDAGVPVGAAFQFALQNGAPLGPPLRHAFYCGRPPTTAAIEEVLADTSTFAHIRLGDVGRADARDALADLMAYVIARDGVLGLFQGSAETGPRALGHRSILANPCNPSTRDNLNLLVKFREAVRPLAPMATREAAHALFELPQSDDEDAYAYMVLTAMARPEARARVPAVVHRDGTARVQIVREDVDPLTHAFLRAMGRRAGVEVSVNTSLNVGSPIAQTPEQAAQVLVRSKGMHALVMVGDDGEAFLVWHRDTTAPKDGGLQLLAWHAAWAAERDRG